MTSFSCCSILQVKREEKKSAITFVIVCFAFHLYRNFIQQFSLCALKVLNFFKYYKNNPSTFVCTEYTYTAAGLENCGIPLSRFHVALVSEQQRAAALARRHHRAGELIQGVNDCF